MRAARRLVTLALLAVSSAEGASIQERAPAVPKFTIEDSPVALRGDVRPRQYLGVIGRAAAWLGWETGEAELWVHPFKLASDFQLSFRIPDYIEPIRGADVARAIEVRPELTTITYTHATFSVRQHILTPLSEPGILVLLDVETIRSLEILVNFRSVFQYAWPAGFGGQYVFWDESGRAFVLSESLRRRNAVIGSPGAVRASSHPAHALPDAPSQFVIAVDPARTEKEYVPIAVAAATAPREEVFTIYRRLIGEAETLYHEKRSHSSQVLDGTTSLISPDEHLNRAWTWSKINLDEAVSCNPDLGCGLVAGWGPSGTSTRPGFGWFFGGDAAINSLAMDAVGLWPDVAQALRFLAQYQREDGKIPHEISQAAQHIPWFSDFPYTYYHADTTPYWILAVWRYWRASGDNAFLQEIWPSLRRAFDWCLSTETDGDGIIENTRGGLGAIEVGELGESIHQDIYLTAVWLEALAAVGDMANSTGEHLLGQRAAALRGKAAESLNTGYWREREGYHAFGILQSGMTNNQLTVWPSVGAAFGLFDAPRAKRTLRHLSKGAVGTDWGARILSAESSLYDPVHYNNGAVWPFTTGFVAWGQYRYRRPWAGFPLIDALAQMTFDWARGRHPELLSGRFYRPLDTAVPHQFFGTSMFVSSVAQGLLGWEPDAPRRRARLTPQIPPQWKQLIIRGLRIGESFVDVNFQQEPNRSTVELEGRGPQLGLELEIPVPPGARNVQSLPAFRSFDSGRVAFEIPLAAGSQRVEVAWEGGLQVEPPRVELEPGQESSGVRVLDFEVEGEGWTLELEGGAGQSYEIRLHGEEVSKVEGARLVGRHNGVSTIVVDFPPGAERGIRMVRLGR